MDTLFRMAPATYFVLGISFFLVVILHIASIWTKRDKRLKIFLVIVVEAYLLNGIAMNLSFDTVHSNVERAAVELGWPLKYFIQNQDRYDPPYPWNMRFAWEVPGKTVIWKKFIHPRFWSRRIFISKDQSS